MTSPSSKVAKNKLAGLVLALAFAGAMLALLVGLNIEKIDSILGTFFAWNFGSGRYLASYDNFLLTASSDSFFEFSSGYGRNSLAKVRLQFPDGKTHDLTSLTPSIVEVHFPDKFTLTRPGSGLVIESYSSGFDSVGFNKSQIESISLSSGSDIAIDFGDGQFVKLPVNRKQLLKLLGPPSKWTLVRGGPP